MEDECYIHGKSQVYYSCESLHAFIEIPFEDGSLDKPADKQKKKKKIVYITTKTTTSSDYSNTYYKIRPLK